MPDLVLYNDNLRQTIISELFADNPTNPNLIIDLLLLVSRKMENGTLVYSEEEFQQVKKFFETPVTKNNWPRSEWQTCSDAVFVVSILRAALKDFKMNLIEARNWRALAVIYTGFAMAI